MIATLLNEPKRSCQRMTSLIGGNSRASIDAIPQFLAWMSVVGRAVGLKVG
jgi:hypothetical protein